VNYATEKAAVQFDGTTISPSDLIGAVESIGYGASVPTISAATPEVEHHDPLLQRLVVAAALGFPVLVVSMITPLQFRNWQWLACALSLPVASSSAWPFHRSAWKNLRQGEASMDTLVSVGVLAAFGWSTYALFFTPAGDNGMTMEMSLLSRAGDDHHLYLEV